LEDRILSGEAANGRIVIPGPLVGQSGAHVILMTSESALADTRSGLLVEHEIGDVEHDTAQDDSV
jgi:hypothetical protein